MQTGSGKVNCGRNEGCSTVFETSTDSNTALAFFQIGFRAPALSGTSAAKVLRPQRLGERLPGNCRPEGRECFKATFIRVFEHVPFRERGDASRESWNPGGFHKAPLRYRTHAAEGTGRSVRRKLGPVTPGGVHPLRSVLPLPQPVRPTDSMEIECSPGSPRAIHSRQQSTRP